MTRLLAIFLLLSAAPAWGQDVWTGRAARAATAPVDAISPQDLLIVLDSMDIEARLSALPADRDGRAHPLGITANTDGLYWDVVFYNCARQGPAVPIPSQADAAAPSERGLKGPQGAEGEGEGVLSLRAGRGCRDFALSAAFDLEYPVSVQTINRFNREYRFARAVLSAEGAPMIEMDVNLEGGVSRDALEVEIEAWRALLLSFSKFVGY